MIASSLSIPVALLIFSSTINAALVREGASLPEFRETDFVSGQRVNNRELRDSVVLLHFWEATDDEQLRAIPRLKTLHDLYGPRGLRIVSIALDTDREAYAAVLARVSAPWNHLCDFGGRDGALTKTFGVRRTPHMILANADHKILSINASWSDIEDQVRRAVGIRPERVAPRVLSVSPERVRYVNRDDRDDRVRHRSRRNDWSFGCWLGYGYYCNVFPIYGYAYTDAVHRQHARRPLSARSYYEAYRDAQYREALGIDGRRRGPYDRSLNTGAGRRDALLRGYGYSTEPQRDAAYAPRNGRSPQSTATRRTSNWRPYQYTQPSTTQSTQTTRRSGGAWRSNSTTTATRLRSGVVTGRSLRRPFTTQRRSGNAVGRSTRTYNGVRPANTSTSTRKRWRQTQP